MDKTTGQRNQKTVRRPDIKLSFKLPPNRKARRRDMKRNRRVDYQGHSYGTSNVNKGAYGKSKYLKAKEKWIEKMKLERIKVANKIARFEKEDLKCKNTGLKESSKELCQQSRSVRPVLNGLVVGGLTKEKQSATSAPENLRSNTK